VLERRLGARRGPVGGELTGGRREELHQAARPGGRHGLGLEEALLADDRQHEERIDAVRPGGGAHRLPVAERVEILAQRARRCGPHRAREAERGAHRPDGAVGLEQPAARRLGRRDRVELEAREAREAELGEDARSLGMAPGELARERRRLVGRTRLARRVAPAEALLGEAGIVGAGVPLGHVHEERARLRPPPEARERARLPVLRSDPCRLREET